jgi:hypothetical protein
MTAEKTNSAASEEHDLVEGPPTPPDQPWWSAVARSLGGATRALVDGASVIGKIIKAPPRRRPEPEPATREQLDELLHKLADQVSSQGDKGATALAESDEFWDLLARLQQTRRRAKGKPRLLKSAPAAAAARPAQAAAEPAEAAAEPAEAPATVEDSAALPATAADPNDLLAGVLSDAPADQAAAEGEQQEASDGLDSEEAIQNDKSSETKEKRSKSAPAKPQKRS